jgi:biotin synthase
MPNQKVYLCAISNILSGSCKEDCSFCTQSSLYKTDIERFNFKDIQNIVDEAKSAREIGAVGFCLVTSGVSLDERRKEFVKSVAKKIVQEGLELNIIGCNGIAKTDDLKELKDAGVMSYNHNLESSKGYYKKICSTHSWDDRFQTALNVKEAGLKLCSGGVFGMGESSKDREDLISSLKELEPDSVAINFFIPDPNIPIKVNNISLKEAKDVILSIRDLLPNSMLMVAGGREDMFGGIEDEMFSLGVNSIVIGDYLTTKGEQRERDIEMLNRLGVDIAKDCYG